MIIVLYFIYLKGSYLIREILAEHLFTELP